VRYALSEIAGEGPLDFEIIDDIARALVAALRAIEAVQFADRAARPYQAFVKETCGQTIRQRLAAPGLASSALAERTPL